MISVGNKPILQYSLEALADHGIERVTLVVGYQREKVQTFCQDGKRFGLDISYAFQEALLGTGHAFACTPVTSDEALLLGADNVVDSKLIKDILDAPPGLALAAQASNVPSKYGVVTMERDRVAAIEEKPPSAASGLVNTGVYRVTRDFHGFVKECVDHGVMGLTHALSAAIGRGTVVHGVISDGLWADALYPWDIVSLNAKLVRDSPQRLPEGFEAGAVAAGPLSLAGDVDVGANAVIQPTSSIGNNVVIGAGSVIENSVVYDDAQIGPGAVIRNSVIGEGARIGARFTALSAPCDVHLSDGWHSVPDFGTIVGEDAHIGGAVTLAPGAIVGNRVRVAAGAYVTGTVADDTQVVR